MTGLVAAHRLTGGGHPCDVYERWPGLGGQVATLEVADGALLERYYHHLFTSDRQIVALYEELGFEDPIEWLPSSMAVFVNGRSHPFTTPLDLLRFKPLPLRSRLRMGLAVLRIKRSSRAAEEMAEITARRWIEDQMGADAWEVVWGPLLRGKFGRRADDVSMAWLWSKLTLRRQIEGKEARREHLGYPRGGWQPLLDRLAERIEAQGGRVLIDRPAARIAKADDRFELAWGPPNSFRSGHDPRAYEEAGSELYDAVLATVPCGIFEALLDPGLLRELAQSYLERLRSITYHAALCLLLEIADRFTGAYWTNISDPDLPFIGLVEQTNLIPPERYGGRRFLYVANYVEHGDELLELSAEQLLDRYEPGLRRVNPAFSRSSVLRLWAFQEPDAQPVVDVGYAERIPPLDTGIPGLVLANTSQIYPEDRGTNYSVRLGEQAADALAPRVAGAGSATLIS